MKKTWSIVIALCMVLAMLTGCGGGADKPAADEPAKESTSTGETAAPADPEVELAFTSGGMTESSQNGYAMKVFAEKVEEYSNGSVTVNLYYDTQLGDTASQVQSVKQGTVDMAVAGIAYYTTYFPEMDALQLPFMFDSYDAAHAAVDGAAGDYIKEQAAGSGLKFLSFWDIGFRHLTNNERAVRSVYDVKGLKLRTLPSTYQVAAWKAFGALPTAIDYSELYQSLQTGLVVGQENPISEIVTMKFYEIQDYMSMTYHCYTPSPVAISEATWNKLTAAQQEAVEKAMADATQACRDKLAEVEETGLQEILDSGTQVEMNPDLSGFQEIAPTVWDAFISDYSDALINLITGD